MENTNKKSWRDVTINEYFNLNDKFQDDELTEYEKQVIKLAFATNKTEEQIWDLNIVEFRKLQVEALWMEEFKINENVKFDKIKINNSNYTIDTNLQNFTVAQYIDFQTFYPKLKSNPRLIGNILACFIVPSGKKYAEDYDIKELVDIINDHLDILTANEIMFFFLHSYLISIRATANYFNWMILRLKKKSKNKEQVAILEEKWNQMKKNTLIGLRSLTK